MLLNKSHLTSSCATSGFLSFEACVERAAQLVQLTSAFDLQGFFGNIIYTFKNSIFLFLFPYFIESERCAHEACHLHRAERKPSALAAAQAAES